MPPEVYDGPLWIEALGAIAFLVLLIFGALKGGGLVDRIADRRFRHELETGEAYRRASRGGYSAGPTLVSELAPPPDDYGVGVVIVDDEVKPFDAAAYDHAKEVLNGR